MGGLYTAHTSPAPVLVGTISKVALDQSGEPANLTRGPRNTVLRIFKSTSTSLLACRRKSGLRYVVSFGLMHNGTIRHWGWFTVPFNVRISADLRWHCDDLPSRVNNTRYDKTNERRNPLSPIRMFYVKNSLARYLCLHLPYGECVWIGLLSEENNAGKWPLLQWAVMSVSSSLSSVMGCLAHYWAAITGYLTLPYVSRLTMIFHVFWLYICVFGKNIETPQTSLWSKMTLVLPLLEMVFSRHALSCNLMPRFEMDKQGNGRLTPPVLVRQRPRRPLATYEIITSFFNGSLSICTISGGVAKSLILLSYFQSKNCPVRTAMYKARCCLWEERERNCFIY